MSRSAAHGSEPPAIARTQTSGVRGAVDSLVQSSLVELFAAYNVAVAPLPRVTAGRLPTVPEVSAAISFVRKEDVNLPGRMTLSLPAAVLEFSKGGAAGNLRGDWARELANQLIGRIKNRLLQFSVRLETGASSHVDSQALARQLAQGSSDRRIYVGRTLRGEVLVTLDGMPDDVRLVYLGPVNVAVEGDVILF